MVWSRAVHSQYTLTWLWPSGVTKASLCAFQFRTGMCMCARMSVPFICYQLLWHVMAYYHDWNFLRICEKVFFKTKFAWKLLRKNVEIFLGKTLFGESVFFIRRTLVPPVFFGLVAQPFVEFVCFVYPTVFRVRGPKLDQLPKPVRTQKNKATAKHLGDLKAKLCAARRDAWHGAANKALTKKVVERQTSSTATNCLGASEPGKIRRRKE